MRWGTFRRPEGDRVGLVVGDGVRLADTTQPLGDLLRQGRESLAALADRTTDRPVDVLPLANAQVGAPLRPSSMRDFMCHLQHLRNIRQVDQLEAGWDEWMPFYFTNHQSIVGPYDDVTMPGGTEQFDFELEVALVIDRPGIDLDPDRAGDHIGGLTILNDWSARDLQMRDMPMLLGPGKGKDSISTLGPWYVTVDELADLRRGPSYHLEMSVSVNGSRVGGGWFDAIDWSLGEIVAHASRGTELHAGDVIGTGTVPTGCLFEQFSLVGPDRFPGWLKPGDVVRMDVDALGHLEQLVRPGPTPRPIRTATSYLGGPP